MIGIVLYYSQREIIDRRCDFTHLRLLHRIFRAETLIKAMPDLSKVQFASEVHRATDQTKNPSASLKMNNSMGRFFENGKEEHE